MWRPLIAAGAWPAVGAYCYHAQEHPRCKRIQVDEILAFVYAKKNGATAKAAPVNTGDVWTRTATDTDTKLIPILVCRRSGSFNAR
jgi:hypothetical protein